MHTVVETQVYLRAAERHGMSEQEREELVTYLAAHPDAGELIKGSGGCRKLRFAGKGKGKRGGFRIVTFYWGENMPVFLFTAYAKDKMKNVSDAQVNLMRLAAKTLVEEYGKRHGKA